jgi:hypothetical protein
MVIIKEMKLEEQLVSATDHEFKLLTDQIEQNPKLKKQLVTPMGKIKQYRFIYGGVPNAEFYSLLQAIKFLRLEGLGKLYFSKAGNSFTGFVTWVENGKSIVGVKIASFYDDTRYSNKTIVNDLRLFIQKEMPAHDKIEWEVEDGNDNAMRQYQKAISKWFPQYKLKWVWDDRKRRWIYTIRK